jgi:hypothetical protein
MRAADPADDVPIPELLGAARAAWSTDSRQDRETVTSDIVDHA